MALTKKERDELTKLAVKCHDKEGHVLPDADEKDLVRYTELLNKFHPDHEIGVNAPIKIKNFVLSQRGKQLVDEGGGEFQGVEVRNHGTEAKPRLVYREWFYVGKKGDPERHCCFIQYEQYADGHQGASMMVDAGRTIDQAAYKRFQR